MLLIFMCSSYICVNSGLEESLVSLGAGIIHPFHCSVFYLFIYFMPLHDVWLLCLSLRFPSLRFDFSDFFFFFLSATGG